jgi:GNAT superfamily N-acetyltransferase
VSARLRRFAGGPDYEAVTEFLAGLYQPDNRDGNWPWPIWEYAYTHGYFDVEVTDRIGLWEDGGRIVGLATYESWLGEAYFNVHADYQHLKPEMLDHAEENLAAIGEDGRRRLKVYVHDSDRAFQEEVVGRGYTKGGGSDWPMSQFVIPSPFPEISVPEGFRLRSLADDNDLTKWDRCLWRGFDHEGEPPADSLANRKKMQSGPHYRTDLGIVAVAPNGDFVCFAGLWFDERNRFGYVEPVATDPDYRRRGLGRACVFEGIRRCKELGATVAHVGTDIAFYVSLGFKVIYVSQCWHKAFA